MRRAAIAAIAMMLGACGSSPAAPKVASGPGDEQLGRARIEAFARKETEAIEWLAAADPRLAARTEISASDEVLKRIGTEAVIAEDTTAFVRGGSIDVFGFAARSRALAHAAEVVASFRDPLPDAAPSNSAIERPQLERELVARMIEEERARAADEQKLGDSSGDLVRAILSTWTPPSYPQEWPERDAWASKHLLEIRDSLRSAAARAGPSDLDVALYPLERLLAPMQFPKSAAAIAQVRVALDEDMRAVPANVAADRLSKLLLVHLGVVPVLATLRQQLADVAGRLEKLARDAGASESAEADARRLVLVESACSTPKGSRARAMRPPPERAAVCGVLWALSDKRDRAAALLAAHDDVVLAIVALGDGPAPAHAAMLTRPPDDEIDTAYRAARERPVVPIGAALAIVQLFSQGDSFEARLARWNDFGEAPLDFVAREMGR